MTDPFAQKPLDLVLPRRRARGRTGFLVSGSNADAIRLIDRWRDWPDASLALIGPEGSGKTHLAHVWMGEAGAEKVAASSLRVEDAPLLVAAGAIVVEDVDRIGQGAEAALFHLLNLARTEGAYVLLTGRGAPSGWRVVTPDLASRLKALTTVSIEPPDDELLTDLLALHLANRHLKVKREVVAYLAPRLERTAAAAAEAARKLDEAALAARKPITRAFAKAALDL